MENLKQLLSTADEAYLIGMSNKGTYKRACKDAETADVSVTYGEDTAEVSIGGETCQIRDPLWESTCSCPSRSVCRHLIAAIVWLRTHTETEEEENLPEPLDEPVALPETLRKALTEVSASELQRVMGSQTAAFIRQIEKITFEESSILSGSLPDGTAVRLLYPLGGSTCSCHKKELCPHKAAVIMAWQAKEGILHPEEFLQKADVIPEEEAVHIRTCAADSYALLCDVLRWGLVRLPENLAEHIEAAAVQSHALKMADAEQMMRSISTNLEESRERRAVFRTDMLIRRISNTARYLAQLQQEQIKESMLGQFRRSYEQQETDLTLLPVGQREVAGGDYEGTIYYFLNMDEKAEQRFFTYSDLRPVFYDSVKPRRTQAPIWGTGLPIRKLMKSRVTLHNAKISDGKLSASNETIVVTRTEANLDCDALRHLICTDFREILRHLSEHPPMQETDRLFFVHPEKCLMSEFDTHAQQFRMAIEDQSGNVIEIRVRYQAERKKLIELLERIGEMMMKEPEKPYVWLCTAQFEAGSLTLFPIEAYNFISIPSETISYFPESVQKESMHAPVVLSLIEDTERISGTLLRSGLQSARSDRFARLAEQAEQYGMQGFSELLQTLADRIEHFRHASGDTADDVLHAFTDVQQYIEICKQKLEILCALDNMQQMKMMN